MFSYGTSDAYTQQFMCLQLPDYHEIIDHPMDFSTIREKLLNDSYSNLEQFEVGCVGVSVLCYQLSFESLMFGTACPAVFCCPVCWFNNALVVFLHNHKSTFVLSNLIFSIMN